MLTTLLRLSALIAVMSVVGPESAMRPTENARGQAAPSIPWPFFIDGPAIFDISSVATAPPDSLVGVEVIAEDVCVTELAGHGFWVTPDRDEARTFVDPAEGPLIDVRVGESVTVHGEVRLTTTSMDQHREDQGATRRAVPRPTPYVYAYTVRPAWPRESAAPARGQNSTSALADCLHP